MTLYDIAAAAIAYLPQDGVLAVSALGGGLENDPYLSQRMSYRLSQSSAELRDIYDAVYQFLIGLGDDVQVKELKLYTAFKRLKTSSAWRFTHRREL